MIDEYILWHDTLNAEDKNYETISSLLVKRDSLKKGFRISDYEGIFYKLTFSTPVSELEIKEIVSKVVPSVQQCGNVDVHFLNTVLNNNEILTAKFYEVPYFELLLDSEFDNSIYFDVTTYTYLKASEINPIYKYTTKCGTRIRYSTPNTKFTVCEVSKASVYLERSGHQDSIHDHQYVHLLLKIDGEAANDTFLLRKESDLIDIETIGSIANLKTLQKELVGQKQNVAEQMYLIGKLHEEMPSTLVGINEFAKILGWTGARVSTLYSRQLKGKKIRNPLPQPLQVLASTPLWKLDQAFQYKARLENINHSKEQ